VSEDARLVVIEIVGVEVVIDVGLVVVIGVGVVVKEVGV
jgi:hypothetical protein